MHPESQDWKLRAKCRKDPDKSKWDADNRGNGQVEKAREACYGCPVKIECARYALQPGARNIGCVWAGIPVTESDTTSAYEEKIRQLTIIADFPTDDEIRAAEARAVEEDRRAQREQKQR